MPFCFSIRFWLSTLGIFFFLKQNSSSKNCDFGIFLRRCSLQRKLTACWGSGDLKIIEVQAPQETKIRKSEKSSKNIWFPQLRNPPPKKTQASNQQQHPAAWSHNPGPACLHAYMAELQVATSTTCRLSVASCGSFGNGLRMFGEDLPWKRWVPS